MIQRNLTPGGDKNGADITLALDALEMAFTRSHINAFVIVGGDSDFIALVEKLKQYDKMVFVVGGRSFTSSILQKNCHEFIAYENLIGIQPAVRKAAGRAPAASTAQLRDALPLLRRALEILADREVSPQLGLLKSTLLQLDSTFSERDYGAHSFREFIQKMANAGSVNLKQVDRSLLVELKDGDSSPAPVAPVAVMPREVVLEAAPQEIPAPVANATPASAATAISPILEQIAAKPHWPMYLRSFKHFLRSVDPSFDERRHGFSSIHDLARQAQREGLLRIERNRQGILRIYPGEQFPQALLEKPPAEETDPLDAETHVSVATAMNETFPAPASRIEVSGESPTESRIEEPVPESPAAAAEEKTRRRRASGTQGPAKRTRTAARRPRAPKKAAEGD